MDWWLVVITEQQLKQQIIRNNDIRDGEETVSVMDMEYSTIHEYIGSEPVSNQDQRTIRCCQSCSHFTYRVIYIRGE